MKAMVILSASMAFQYLASCKESTFTGGGGKAQLQPVSHAVSLTCGTAQPGAAAQFSGMIGTKVQIEGELCSLTENVVGSSKLSILFVLDYSNSMATADPGSSVSCGRLQAADAIIRKMAQQASQGNAIPVEVGVVHFHDTASVPVPLTPIANFSGQLNGNNFCGFEIGATNYQAAFQQAQQVLAAAPGKKVIYFITDGAPTRPSGNSIFSQNPAGSDVPYTAGEQAVRALQAGAPDLVVNALYLQDPASVGQPAPRDPQQYLISLVGSPDRFRVATNADALAAQIDTFEIPKVENLDVKTIQAELASPALGSRPIPLESLNADPVRKGVWLFRTAPIELFGTPGQAVENRVLIRSQLNNVPETSGVVMFRANG